MTSIAGSLNRSSTGWITWAGMAAVIVAAIVIPNLQRSRMAANHSYEAGLPTAVRYQSAGQDEIRLNEPVLVSAALIEPAAKAGAATDRKMVRNSSMGLVVQKPAETAEKIRALAEGMGGFLVSSEVSGGQDAASGSLIVRVPSARFEEACAEIRKLGLRVESQKVEAQDVTRQYVDEDANLRNLRAEEVQYLAILKQAHTVKDTLEVSEKLSEVRGQIEQRQAEFDALSKQIETVVISISLRTEAEARVFGLRWRPLYQLKLALREGLEAVAGYGAAMASIVFYLPAVLLWMGTILLGAAAGWKALQWAGRVFFSWPKQSAVQNG
jgi:hypothetical protein